MALSGVETEEPILAFNHIFIENLIGVRRKRGVENETPERSKDFSVFMVSEQSSEMRGDEEPDVECINDIMTMRVVNNEKNWMFMAWF